MRQQLIKDLVLIVLALVLAVSYAAQISVYNMPFGGCDSSRWMTLEPGCSAWPDFAHGAVFCVLFAALTPRRYQLPLFVVVFAAIVACLGGPLNMRTMEVRFIESFEGYIALFVQGTPLFLGALTIWILQVLCHKLMRAYARAG